MADGGRSSDPEVAVRQAALAAILARARVIPVVTIPDLARAVPLARTLVAAGLPVIEVTLRTPAGLDALSVIAREVPEAIPVAGTVTRPEQIARVEAAGAAMIVTPGTTPALAAALADAPLPAMPGCASPGEAMALAEAGFRVLKFFPAAASGGVAWLRAIAGPLPDLAFCPTGGIDARDAGDYLALRNVPCLGGSWMVPAAALAEGDFATIERLAREAAALG